MSLLLAATLLPQLPAREEQSRAHQCNAVDCGRVSVPTEDWKCPACNTSMRYGAKRDRCPDCARTCLWLRRGNRWDHSCECQETQQMRQNRIASDREREIREAKDRAENDRRDELQRARKSQTGDIVRARECWENEKLRKCKVARNDPNTPRPFCRFCPKFTEK